MSEHKEPIPSMIYNAAVGGHVTNSQQIIDENLNREQNDINQETVGTVPYNSTNPNGMGRVVLKKNDNFKEVVEAQTNGNTIFVIKYDFTLTDNVTIPKNCILEFDGGSVDGAYTITGTNTIIKAIPVQIFGNDITIGYNSFIPYNNVIYPEWFGTNDLGYAISTSCMIKANQSVIKLQPKKYHLTTPAKLLGGIVVDLNNAIVNVDADVPAFVDYNYQGSTDLNCDNIHIKNGKINLTTNRTEGTSYVIDIANAFYLTLEKLNIANIDGITLNNAFGIRLGRKTTGYTGPTYVNTIKDCTLCHIKIESDTTDSYMINNKIWASNINDGAINISASSWQIISNQIVGGKKGAIYIPPYGKPSILKIIGNYFDGSYYNIDTQNGINIDYDTQVDTYMKNSVISNNTFWHQKGYGIYGKMINCIIANNVFDDCDFYNIGVPDILLKGGGGTNQICSNTFVRSQYVDLQNVHHARIAEDTESFTRPPIIKTEGECWEHHIIQNNVCASENYYNKALYAESDSKYSYVLVNNCSPIFCNNGWHGNSSKRPTNVQIGFQYFDTSLSPARPIYWNGSAWVDATGAEV